MYIYDIYDWSQKYLYKFHFTMMIKDGLLSPTSSNLNFYIILSNWSSVVLKSCQIKLHRLLWKFEFYNLDIQSWMSSH